MAKEPESLAYRASQRRLHNDRLLFCRCPRPMGASNVGISMPNKSGIVTYVPSEHQVFYCLICDLVIPLGAERIED
jgi:hypothetical protein